MNGHPRRVGSRPRRASAQAEAVAHEGRPLRTPEKVVVALCLLGGYALVFLLVDEWNAYSASAAISVINPRTAWDAYIPFVPEVVYVYLAYYAWLLIPIPILRNRAEFYGAVYAFALTQTVAVAIYLAYPSRMERPPVPGDDLSAQLVRMIYEVDRGYNILPSLHVAHSVLVALLFASLRPRWFPPVAFFSGLICISTVLVKQHYLLDLPAGVAVAIACYYPTMAYSRRRLQSNASEDAAFTS